MEHFIPLLVIGLFISVTCAHERVHKKKSYWPLKAASNLRRGHQHVSRQIRSDTVNQQYVPTTLRSNEGETLRMHEKEKEALSKLYGPQVFKEHTKDFLQVGRMGQELHTEHKTGFKPFALDEATRRRELDRIRNNIVNENEPEDALSNPSDEQWDSRSIKDMLKGLLLRLEEEEKRISFPKELNVTHGGYCNLHGLWLSTVAGVAIQLLPRGNNMIATKIIDLPQVPHQALITSHWIGEGMISSENPTTLIILFQEHSDPTAKVSNHFAQTTNNQDLGSNLRTAVFAGQCLWCADSPVLQGTWVLFPNSQNCFPSGNPLPSPASDIMYLLRR